jgi:hypothetical protein
MSINVPILKAISSLKGQEGDKSLPPSITPANMFNHKNDYQHNFLL